MAGSRISIYCPHCHQHTSLDIARAAYGPNYDPSYTGAIWKKNERESWWIGICNHCDEPVLSLNAGEAIYPNPLPSPTDHRIPKDIGDDLTESKFCFSIGAFRASAVMARRSMQSACIDKGAKKKNLVDQVDELKNNGVITNDLKEWADVVRWVGNDAAHPNKDIVEKDDAKDILELAEQFLHVIYVAPAIAKERRTKRNK
jgi:hypothetical protein